MRDGLSREMKLERAKDVLFELANKVEDELAGGAGLEETTQRLALKLRTLEAIDVTGRDKAGQPIADLPAATEFLRAAFEADSGIETALTETDDGGYFILRVDRITPPSVRPLETVREEVAATWTARQRAETARTKAQQAAERIKDGAEMASLGR